MPETRINLKQIFITAAITCIFTIAAAFIADFITTKQANLSYTVASGPPLQLQGSYKRIFSVSVQNNGRKEVLDAYASIEVRAGTIEEASYSASADMELNEKREDTRYKLIAPIINPKENFSISLLVSTISPEFSPQITVRGRGVTGSLRSSASGGKFEILYLIAGAVAALLGLISSMSPMVRRISAFTSASSRNPIFIPSASTMGPFNRNELIAYILGLCSLNEHSRLIRFAPSEITYRGASDYVVSEALASQSAERNKYITALKCMLLLANISEDSIMVIVSALKSLENTSDDEIKTLRSRALNPQKDPVKLRESIAHWAGVKRP